MKILALYSPAPGCGKTTIAKALAAQTADAEVYSFADTIRKMLDRLLVDLGFDGDQIALIKTVRKEERLPQTLGVSYRQLMRTLGTEWGRDCVHPEIWIQVMLERLNTAKRLGRKLIIIDDMRFENEYQMVTAFDGLTWRIERPGAVDGSTHRSDGGLEHIKDWDHVFVNSGDMTWLERECATLCLENGLPALVERRQTDPLVPEGRNWRR